MFRRTDPTPEAARLRLTFEGREIHAEPGDSLAAALLGAGIAHFRDTPAHQAPRAPYCMMGVCFDCLVEIEGLGVRQACLVPAAEGMAVRRAAIGAPNGEGK